jgi:hypothetical protein
MPHQLYIKLMPHRHQLLLFSLLLVSNLLLLFSPLHKHQLHQQHKLFTSPLIRHHLATSSRLTLLTLHCHLQVTSLLRDTLHIQHMLPHLRDTITHHSTHHRHLLPTHLMGIHTIHLVDTNLPLHPCNRPVFDMAEPYFV